jgi:hypothetical protein
MSDKIPETEIESKICSKWGIDSSVVHRPFKFEQGSGPCTIPECRDYQGLLHIKVVYSGLDSENCRLLDYHEGAHIYLFHLGYPPSCFDRDTYEFIADYYAYCLQMKMRPQDLNDLTLLPILHQGVGQAMQHAIMQHLGRRLDEPALLQRNYQPVRECLRNAPPPPIFPSKPLDAEQIKEVEELLSKYYQEVYQKSINFSLPRC